MARTSLFRLVAAIVPIAFASTLQAQAAAPAPDLSDPEVAHVAVTANSLDIELARFAQSRTTTAAVRQFAATMITDHTAVNAQAAALAGKLGVTPADNAVSQSLQAGARDARASLEKLAGAAFDRAYMDREIGYHQAVLDALDQLLIPTTSNGELKALLVQVRPAIATHLEHAKKVRADLGGATQ
jgi:putative membrane protein